MRLDQSRRAQIWVCNPSGKLESRSCTETAPLSLSVVVALGGEGEGEVRVFDREVVQTWWKISQGNEVVVGRLAYRSVFSGRRTLKPAREDIRLDPGSIDSYVAAGMLSHIVYLLCKGLVLIVMLMLTVRKS
jgi:hypothetical protein